jgi:hypothetical protein
MRLAVSQILRRPARLALGLALAAGFGAMAAGAQACSAPSISVAQPIDGGVLKVSRIAGAHAGLPDTWDMRYDAWFCNPDPSALTVDSVKIEHLNGNTVTKTVTIQGVATEPAAPTARVWPITIAKSSDNQLVMVRDDTQYAFPLPTSIRVTFTLSSGPKIVQTYPVAEHVDPGPLHGFFFPRRQTGLAANEYWVQGRHAEDNTFQRWAYDLWLQKWDGSKWIDHDPGSDATQNSSYYTWNQPVYAVSDGVLIGCNRGAPDNLTRPDANGLPKQVGNVPGGNVLWVRTGDETQLYAHLKHNSIPMSLCPFSDDAEHKLAGVDDIGRIGGDGRIGVGQLLGYTGASGWSQGGTHLHFHTFMGLPGIWGGSETGIDADARPMEFVNVRVQENAGKPDPAKWNQVTSPKLMPYNTIIEANDCGFDPSSEAGKTEALQLGVKGGCFLEMTNAMWQNGDRPTSVDVRGTGASSLSSTVWRPANGIGNIFLAGLDDAGLDAAKQTWVVQNGFRVRQVEAYVEGGKLKHAVIFEKGPAGGQQILRRDIDNATMANLGAQNPGFVPVNLSVAVVNGVARYDALMEKKAVGSLIVNVAIPHADLDNQLKTQSKAGRNLAYLDSFDDGGKTFFSAIWYGNLPATTALPDQSAADVATTETSKLAAGKLMQGITQYKVGTKTMYVGYWR